MNQNNNTQIDLSVLKNALVNLLAERQLFNKLIPEEQAQIEALPNFIKELETWSELEVNQQKGSMIDKNEALNYRVHYERFRREQIDNFSRLRLIKEHGPLIASASLFKKLLERVKDVENDLVQIMLIKRMDSVLNREVLGYVVCLMDKDGNLYLDPRNPTINVREDVLDDMRPCPPCGRF